MDSTDPVERETVAEFWPPNALQRFNAWEAEQATSSARFLTTR